MDVSGFDCASNAENAFHIHRLAAGRYTVTIDGLDSGTVDRLERERGRPGGELRHGCLQGRAGRADAERLDEQRPPRRQSARREPPARRWQGGHAARFLSSAESCSRAGRAPHPLAGRGQAAAGICRRPLFFAWAVCLRAWGEPLEEGGAGASLLLSVPGAPPNARPRFSPVARIRRPSGPVRSGGLLMRPGSRGRLDGGGPYAFMLSFDFQIIRWIAVSTLALEGSSAAGSSRMANALRYLDLVLLVLALPVFIAADLPMAALPGRRRRLDRAARDGAADESCHRRRQPGVTAVPRWAGSAPPHSDASGPSTLAVLLVGLLDSKDAGLAAAVLAAILFTVHLGGRLLSRLHRPARRSPARSDGLLVHQAEGPLRPRRLLRGHDRAAADLRQRRQERRVQAPGRVQAPRLDPDPPRRGSTSRSTAPSSTCSWPAP